MTYRVFDPRWRLREGGRKLASSQYAVDVRAAYAASTDIGRWFCHHAMSDRQSRQHGDLTVTRATTPRERLILGALERGDLKSARQWYATWERAIDKITGAYIIRSHDRWVDVAGDDVLHSPGQWCYTLTGTTVPVPVTDELVDYRDPLLPVG